MKRGEVVAKLTDRQRKFAIADYAECGNYSAVGRKYGVSKNTIRKLVQGEPKLTEIADIKKEQNTLDMIEYLDSKKGMAQSVVDACLRGMLDPERLSEASLKELATVMGITIDKFTGNAKAEEAALSKLDELIKGITDAAAQP